MVEERRSRWLVRPLLVAAVCLAGWLLAAGSAWAGFGNVQLVSVNSTGTGAAGAQSEEPAISADGRFVAFTSTSDDIVPAQDDRNSPGSDVFLRDLETGATTLVSHSQGDPLKTGDEGSNSPTISADGRWVAYVSSAQDLATGFGAPEKVYLFDRLTGTNVGVDHLPGDPTGEANNNSLAPIVSADGNFVLYTSNASDLVTGQTDMADTLDLFLYDRALDENTLVSHTSASATAAGNGPSGGSLLEDLPTISADGARVAFNSSASDLVDADTDADDDVLLFDRPTGSVQLVSESTTPGQSANGRSTKARISADGSHVAYLSSATDLVAGFDDQNGGNDPDVFLFDVAAGATVLASHVPGGAARTGSDFSDNPAISADGRVVAFDSAAVDLAGADANGDSDVFVLDAASGAVTLGSSSAVTPGTTGNARSNAPQISADGRFVAFGSLAGDLVPGQIDGASTPDVFVRDRARAVTALASHAPGGLVTGADAVSAASFTLAPGGSAIAFTTDASNLSPLDGNGVTDAYAARNVAPAAAFGAGAGDAPLTVVLDGSASSDPDGVIEAYEWDHGDGTSSTGVNSSHTYAAPGSYTLKLTVRDETGATSTATHVIEVQAPPLPGGSPPGPSLPLLDQTDPLLESLAIEPRRITPKASGPSIAATRGARVTYTLSEPASVRFTVRRARPGRRVKGKCRKPRRSNRARRHCRRYVKLKGGFTHQGAAGVNSFRFTGRLRGRKLRPGRYRLVARPSDLAGNRGRAVRASFRVKLKR